MVESLILNIAWASTNLQFLEPIQLCVWHGRLIAAAHQPIAGHPRTIVSVRAILSLPLRTIDDTNEDKKTIGNM